MATKKFTVIRDDAFDSLQLEAGVILSTFDPANPVKPQSDDIIATTTGGISVNCTATFSDYGEDVDNVPNNMMEFKQLDSWDDCSVSYSSIQFNAENTQWALGAADIEDHDTYKVVKPRRDVNLTDFKDIWWVGDKANGGAFAVKIHNALSTSGLSIQTTKNGKGTNQMTITGHVSLAAQDVMPIEFFDIQPDPSTVVHTVTQTLTKVTSDYSEPTVDDGESLEVTLTPDAGYAISSVLVTIGGVDATGTTWNAETSKVTIASVTANVVITATAVEAFDVTQALENVTSSFTGTTVASGSAFEATLTADSTYTISSVTVEMDNTDITSTAWDSATGKVSIASVTGDIEITASAS